MTLPANLVDRAIPADGRFGPYGGQAPETLMATVCKLASTVAGLLADPMFGQRLAVEQRDFVDA